MESIQFFNSLFEYIEDDSNILVWTLPDKKSYWFHDPVKAAEMCQSDLFVKNDVYVGCGLVSDKFLNDIPSDKDKAYKRCPADEIQGIAGFWVDIDIKDPAHAKKNLPPDQESAIELINKLAFKPSIIINTGHGLQGWWVFKEPWMFDDKKERKEASMMAARWIYTFKQEAVKRGWDVDSTIDLSRVFRVPGTFNNKKEPVPVTIIDINDNRYNPEEFDPYMVNIDDKTIETKQVKVDSFILDSKAQPPFDKWEALKIIDDKIVDSWNHNRTEFQDQSASSYDMSLATFAAQAEWSDQEIVNLLISHRRIQSEDLKLRKDYYSRTIQKARQAIEKDKDEQDIEELLERVEKTETSSTSEEKEKTRELLLQSLSKAFNVKVKRIIKYIADEPQYRLETKKGSILIGGASSILNQNTFRAKVFAATNQVITRCKGKDWDNLVKIIGRVCVEESIGDEATERGIAKSWIEYYLKERTIIDDIDAASEQDLPFLSEGSICIFGNDFRKFLRISQMEKITAKAMGSILRVYGCVPDRVNVKINNNLTTRSIWKLPNEEFNPVKYMF